MKFTKKGKVEIKVKIIKNDQDESFLKISVKDTGIGISLDNQDKLFRLFGFVQDEQLMNKDGVGVGLVISERIVSKFDGKITFKSESGKGSNFTFTFKIQIIN